MLVSLGAEAQLVIVVDRNSATGQLDKKEVANTSQAKLIAAAAATGLNRKN